MPEPTTLGAEFALALAARDPGRLSGLLAPGIDFEAITPRRTWQAADPEAVVSIILGSWFDDADEIERLEAVDTDAFADRERVGYRLSVNNAEGRFLVEQQAYISQEGGKIAWMRVLCSGFRPAPLE